MLGHYLRGIGAYPKGRAGRVGLRKKSEGGETGKVELRKKSGKIVEGTFCGVWKTWLILELLCVFMRQECENQGEEHYRQEREENRGFFLPDTVYFHTRKYFTKENLFSNR